MTDIIKELHKKFHPIISKVLSNAQARLYPLLMDHLGDGWKSDLTPKLNNCFRQFISDANHMNDRLRGEAYQALTIILILSELEREYFPEWLELLLNELYRGGVFKYDEQEDKIKVY